MPFAIVRNDITKMKVDAIVNAANASLLGGGGVDGAIHRAAGPQLLEECRTLGGCRTGEAKLTKGYMLPAKYVIHTVGPVWHGGGHGEKELLTACYYHSLELAHQYACETVAFPLISAGAYGYPKDQAMDTAVSAITHFLLSHDMTVYLVVFGHTELMTGKKLFRDIKEYIDDVYAQSHVSRNTEQAREFRWQQSEKAALDLDRMLSPFSGAGQTEPKPGPMRESERRSSLFHRSKRDAVPEAQQGMLSCCEVDEEEEESLSVLADSSTIEPDLGELLKRTDESFSQALLRLIDEKGMTDAQCYKLANVDRKLFSKIRSNPEYRPSKPTVFAFAIALELSLPETEEFLGKAGFALSHSSRCDIALEYCITHRIFNIIEINEVLFEFDLPLLGSGRIE